MHRECQLYVNLVYTNFSLNCAMFIAYPAKQLCSGQMDAGAFFGRGEGLGLLSVLDNGKFKIAGISLQNPGSYFIGNYT